MVDQDKDTARHGIEGFTNQCNETIQLKSSEDRKRWRNV